MTEYNFIIPGQPVAKGRPRVAIQGHRIHAYTPEKTRQYECDAKIIIKQAMAGRPPLEGPVSVVIDARFKKPRSKKVLYPRIDIDNICKIILDSMNGIVVNDDSQVVSLFAAKAYSNDPCVVVNVRPVGKL